MEFLVKSKTGFTIIIMAMTAMVFMMLSTQFVFADDVDIDGGIYDGVPWRITSEYELVIGEEGLECNMAKPAPDSEGNPVAFPWEENKSSITSVAFEGTVHGIGDCCSKLFADYTKLTSVDLSGLETSQATNMMSMFYNCLKLSSVDLKNLDTGNVTTMSGMFNECSGLKNVDMSGLDASSVSSMYYMFSSCSSLESINMTGIDTRNVTNMGFMFSYCRKLSNLDLEDLDTGSVWDMGSMFYGCRSLEGLSLTGWDTGNVTNMKCMFSGCSALTSIDLKGLDTSKVINMNGLFSYCSSLESIDMANMNTSKLKDMASLFSDCNNLTSVDLSGIDTSSVTSMGSMFIQCKNLTSVDLSGIDTSRVTSMSSMFSHCDNLTSVDLSGIDTSSVTNMGDMFYYCSSMTSIDLTGFSTSKVTYMKQMFCGCTSVTSINIIDFDTTSVTNMTNMFSGCSKLTDLGLGKYSLLSDDCSLPEGIWKRFRTVDGKSVNGPSYENTRISRYDGDDPGWYTTRACPNGHNYGEWIITDEATCTEDGSKEKVCKVCGDKVTEVIESGHVWMDEYTIDQEATCSEEGSESIHCLRCGEIKEGTARVIEKKPHNYSDWFIIEGATCTTAGNKEKVCSVCRDVVTETIPAKGHDWKEPTYKWATNKKSVTAERTCNNNPSHKETETVGTIIHAEKPATCSSTGFIEYTSEAFENEAFEIQIKQVSIPIRDHDWGYGEVTTPATCSSEGELTYTCSYCSETKTSTISIDPEAHQWNEGVVTAEPDCFNKGSKVYTCGLCGVTKTETIPALQHRGTMQYIETKYATCTEDGNSECYYCTRCKRYYQDANGTELFPEEYIIIPSPGHSWEEDTVTRPATCTNNGERTLLCIECGKTSKEVIKALGHKWDSTYTVDKKATYATAGSKSIHCSVCNAKKAGSVVAIPKLKVKPTTLSKLTPAKKAITVKWKKGSSITGYQIQYALNSKFTSGKKTVTITKAGTVSKKITKLKAKKKYYVRVRTFKTVSGKKYYSTWSKYKYTKTK